ncbi:PilN domain-containing protein [Methylothermus subterraneus]
MALPPAWQRFWHWWQDQLSQAIPQQLRSWFSHRQPILIALPSEEELQAWQWEGRGQAVPLRPLAQPSGLEAMLSSLRARESAEEVSFTLVLLPGQYLRKTILLPSAVEENLRQVIAFELDRQTPFSADQVYFTSRIVERLPASRQLKVEIVLTPRAFLDAQLTRLHQANLKPHRVDAALLEGQTPVPLGLDLLPSRWRPRETRWQKRLDWSLAGVLAALLGLALALPLVMQHRILSALEAQVAQLRKAAQASSALQQQVTALEQAARFGITRKQATPPMIVAIEELAQRLPQDTWLTGFSYRNGELRIDGSSPNASKLIEILESSPIFQNTHFVSPVTQDRNTGLERFQISMTLGYERDAPK